MLELSNFTLLACNPPSKTTSLLTLPFQVWFVLRVTSSVPTHPYKMCWLMREVPGSIPGQALPSFFFFLLFLSLYGFIPCLFCFDFFILYINFVDPITSHFHSPCGTGLCAVQPVQREGLGFPRLTLRATPSSPCGQSSMPPFFLSPFLIWHFYT